MTADGRAIHLLSFNLCGQPSFQPSLTERVARFCQRIDSSDLDVVLFQEVWTRQIQELLRAGLPSFPFLARRPGLAGRPAGGVATFSRLPIGAVSFRSYRGIAPAVGGLRFRVKRAIHSAFAGVLTAELVGTGVVVANTHLTANRDGDWSAENRYHDFQRRQVRRLHATVDRRRGSGLTILGGDFNLASDGPLYPPIIGGGAWRDPFAGTDIVTFHARFLPPGSTAHRIDYVLLHGDATAFPVLDTELWFTEPEPFYVSDHIGLSVRVGLLATDG